MQKPIKKQLDTKRVKGWQKTGKNKHEAFKSEGTAKLGAGRASGAEWEHIQ